MIKSLIRSDGSELEKCILELLCEATKHNIMLAQIVKFILALLLLLCLLRMPYGYYQFVRVAAMLGFLFLAYDSSQKQNKSEMIVYVGLAILFQPLIKISLGRLIWNIVDVIVAAGLLYSLISGRMKK
jgi:hypothetical protein